MKALLQLLSKYYALLLFLVLEGIALTLVVRSNRLSYSAFFTSANQVAASFYSFNQSVVDYFNLRQVNKQLVEENNQLKDSINQLNNTLQFTHTNEIITNYTFADSDITFIPAHVIQLTNSRQRNFITINRGARDGISAGMAVVCADGAVGIIYSVSDKFATIIPIINNKLRVSSKFAKNGYIGTLHWNVGNTQTAQLEDIARHIEVNDSDLITTSGFSNIFPPDVPLGYVQSHSLTDNDAYHLIVVKLAVDFNKLHNVYVVKNNNIEELINIQEQFPQ